jgi:hypothetical protein
VETICPCWLVPGKEWERSMQCWTKFLFLMRQKRGRRRGKRRRREQIPHPEPENGFIFIHSTKRGNRSAALAILALMRLAGKDFTQAKADVDKILKKSSGKICHSKINIDLKDQIKNHEKEFKEKEIRCSKTQRLADIVRHLKTIKLQMKEARGTPDLGQRQQENLGEKEATHAQ